MISTRRGPFEGKEILRVGVLAVEDDELSEAEPTRSLDHETVVRGGGRQIADVGQLALVDGEDSYRGVVEAHAPRALEVYGSKVGPHRGSAHKHVVDPPRVVRRVTV